MVCSHKGEEPEEKTASLKWRTTDKKTNSEKKNVLRIPMFNRSAWSTASGCMIKRNEFDVFVGIEERLAREDAQDICTRLCENGFKKAAADARITEQDNETGRCT